jgi:UDP-glucose 4-epimerase
MRPGLMFKREAAAGVRRLFAGPFAPGSALRPRFVPVVPQIAGLRFQAVHSLDAADAFRLAVLREVRICSGAGRAPRSARERQRPRL